ncbi:MAG: KH domain-containing protein [Caldilineaceae bacterium]|nr:KH domain-containing protein [Caldilineaceae bacterium]
MEDLIKYIAEALVEDPEGVSVYTKDTRRATILKLRVAPADTGRVIGKGGRVANAMRGVLGIAARNEYKAVILEID